MKNSTFIIFSIAAFSLSAIVGMASAYSSNMASDQQPHASDISIRTHDGNTFVFTQATGKISLSNYNDQNEKQAFPVTQIFDMGSGEVKLPIDEIDYVEFRNLTDIAPRAGVKRIGDYGICHIVSCKGGILEIDGGILESNSYPIEGDYLYYDNFCDIFPYGFSGRIKHLISQNGEIRKYEYEEVTPEEIFEDYRFVSDGETISADFGSDEPPLYSRQSDETVGRFFRIFGNINLKLSSVYTDVLKDSVSYKANISVDRLSASVSRTHHKNAQPSEETYIRPTYILPTTSATSDTSRPRVGIEGSYTYSMSEKINECDLKADYNQNGYTQYWTFTGPKKFRLSRFSFESNDGETGYDENRHLLNGSFTLTLSAKFRIKHLFHKRGTDHSVRISTTMASRFGTEQMDSLARDYYETTYKKAEFSCTTTGSATVNTYTVSADGKESKGENPVSGRQSIKMPSVRILPNFEKLEAFTDNDSIYIKAICKERLVADLPVSFEIFDKTSKKSVALVESSTLQGDDFGEQCIGANILLSDDINEYDIRNLRVRALFKIDNKQLKGKPYPIYKPSSVITPVIYYGASQGIQVVSGLPITGSASSDTGIVILGNIIPARHE